MTLEDDPAVVTWLRRISEQLDALPAAIAFELQRKAPRALRRNQRQALSVLLHALVTSKIGSTVFTSCEALAYAAPLPDLQVALVAAIGPTDAPGAPKRLGKLLAFAEGVVLDGLHVERSAPTREGMLWRVTRV